MQKHAHFAIKELDYELKFYVHTLASVWGLWCTAAYDVLIKKCVFAMQFDLDRLHLFTCSLVRPVVIVYFVCDVESHIRMNMMIKFYLGSIKTTHQNESKKR